MTEPASGRVLEGKIAIVTGSGQGVGRGIALALSGAGCQVVVCGRTPRTLQETAALIEDAEGTALVVKCDVSQRSEVESCVERTLNTFGAIDILVNNAQTVRLGPLLDLIDDDMALVYDTGPVGAFRFMKACFPALSQSRGSIVNLASGSGVQPQPGQAPYAAAKEGMRALTRVAASEWGVHGIRVNAICPFASSPAMDLWQQAVPHEYEQAMHNVYLRRIGDPVHDIGPVVVFLSSSQAQYVTGATLMVDGGQNYLG
ncbi:MAG: meso-butanediol dehydrogenase / (S,S)-butanediol dehydrogenase / diacetyl reductase [Mycobacterium sp.]|jgi:NAD(P)-dependent dehydrogenase (short-subunit alcohol dehydrogenase family)|nr:NAD(P)-dependent oxidoreductase [Mycobacterium sp.]MDT5412203.1 meso-butanediol dehydrogenase / (S,S)-butanediol dehydrogenase / diacetyl reductase [Mycobacterium sp.]